MESRPSGKSPMTADAFLAAMVNKMSAALITQFRVAHSVSPSETGEPILRCQVPTWLEDTLLVNSWDAFGMNPPAGFT